MLTGLRAVTKPRDDRWRQVRGMVATGNKKPGIQAGLGDKLLIRVFVEASNVDVV